MQAAVKALNYVPNSLARSLKVGLGDSVGVVIDGIADPFFSALTSAVETEAHQAGLNVVLGSTGFDADARAGPGRAADDAAGARPGDRAGAG